MMATIPFPGHARRWRWAPAATVAGEARKVIADALGRWGLADLADDVVLMASEVVSNACKYGRGPIVVRLRPCGCGVTCKVTDSEPVFALTAAPDDDEGGRGLMIVQGLAAVAGVRPARFGRGKTVFFTCERRRMS